MKLAEQTAESVMFGVGRVTEETQHARGIAEAAIAEMTSVRGQVENRVASQVAQVYRCRGRTVGFPRACASPFVVELCAWSPTGPTERDKGNKSPPE